MKGCIGHLINLLCPVNCNDPCMWLLLAGEGGLIGSSSLRDPIEKKMYPKLSYMYIAGYMYLYRVLISFVST